MSEPKRRISTKAVKGRKLGTHFHNIMATEPQLPEDVRSRLVNRLCVYISSARFRADPPEPRIVAEVAPQLRADTAGESGDGTPDTATAFDPYAFSVVAVLAKDGEEALRDRLAGAPDVDALKQLARAQRLSLPRDLLADPGVDVPALADAIVAAGHKRVANRVAAAG